MKNLDSTMERIGTIGSKAVYISDFAMFNDKFEVTYVTEDLIPKAVTITPDEMKQITKSAKKNNQGMVMLVSNLYDPLLSISVALTGSSVERTKGAFRTPGLDLRTADEETIMLTFNKIWPGWREIILKQADKAEAAGIDYMTINPNDQAFEYILKSDILDDRYRELIPEVRKRFSGKIGLIGMLPHVNELESVHDVDFVLISWDPNGDYIGRDIFADTRNTDIDEIEASFTEWLSRPEWEKFKGKEVYISVTLPSYTGALQEGWIEPALGEERWTINYREQALGYEGLFRALYKGDYNIKGVFSYGYWWSDQLYPVTKDIRNDLMHTIRQKDAENVFYKWSKVFV
ncbi:hypothetical protein [Methanocalculus sp.]|uniref:hypothetical protein n=1 Tax=Methanocalculus sp. TaxID=2004547 RepID=UPI00262D0356|nr:hypothetical protein [Methanocalculus sp.]MDG6251355.1 hypothetical protein [Methanocalculus sp.]